MRGLTISSKHWLAENREMLLRRELPVLRQLWEL